VKSLARVKLTGFKCERCEHEWCPKNPKELPKTCPKCRSPYWDTPRKQK
jgi:Zn finger protein HypA/HybF involved in hydrogenase expression